MSDFGDALGTAAEGGLFARAVAGRRKGDKSAAGHFVERDCLNCGSALTGPYCQQCGQQAHLHRTLGAFLHDLLHGALHFEGKTWHTLPLLAWKPGELTRRYIHGERARFVSPMALFLFSIFLMFAVFQAIGLTPPTEINTTDGFKSNMVAMQKDLTEKRDSLTDKLAKMPATDPDRAAMEAKLTDAENALEGIDKVGNAISNGQGIAKVTTIDTGVAFLDHGLEKWRKNPGLMLYKLQSNSYKFSWLLIPLSIPFMWVLFFWKRGVRAYDHAIFVTYSIAFMSLLFVALSVLYALGLSWGIVSLIGTTIPLIHIYRQLRGTYLLSRFSAIWRLVVLTFFISIIATVFLQILLVLGAF
ncbi:MAG: DUF3667 domain-containing protein [Sphingomonadaceae bacterium]